MMLDERVFSERLRIDNQKTFLKMIEDYEKSIAPSMRAQGFKRINQKERTVIFSFGEMTFSRSRWKKGDTVRIPVDEKLGLEPRSRFSQELLYQITRLSNYMPYRKVVEVMELLKSIYITKNTVQHALDVAGHLLEDKADYDSLSADRSADRPSKIKAERLYIEGDGVWVKQSTPNKQGKSVELSHFVVHTGSKKGKRNILKDKFEVVSTHYHQAKDKLLELIMERFEITPETVIVTNSDGGKGYSPNLFKELVSGFRPKEHFHIWDAFHVNQAIKTQLRPFPSELIKQAFQALKNRDKSQLKTVLDTAESLIDSDEKLATFQRFRRQLLRNFKYTGSPEAFGLSSSGIGIMESQHRKITYRMKNRGMYWSKKGADTMSQTILLSHAGELRDLFFGQWRTDFQKIKDQEKKSLGQFCDSSKFFYTLPTIKRPIAKPKYSISIEDD
ncbi:ISLre2 family transposase [Streptococcus thermophilus]|uniref:ISLre2 family transposase n=1 Tax=Streptococcus thermophilus TaxID=1308 RepID=UPI002618BA6E|nr:ISLre2 family transposase [Streptococcus thermophilus]